MRRATNTPNAIQGMVPVMRGVPTLSVRLRSTLGGRRRPPATITEGLATKVRPGNRLCRIPVLTNAPLARVAYKAGASRLLPFTDSRYHTPLIERNPMRWPHCCLGLEAGVEITWCPG